MPAPDTVETGRTLPQRRLGQQRLDLALRFREAVLVDEVGLRQRHHGLFDAEQAGDVDMLPRLRHHPVIGRDNEEQQVDPRGVGQHRMDKLLVARHVDEADDPPIGLRPIGEAERDGCRAPLSLSRSVSTPVNRRTSEVLPWSIWPAVP